MRVLIVVNQVSREQSALWEAVASLPDTDVVLLGASPRTGLEAYEPSATTPCGMEVIIDRPTTLRRGSDHLWWRFPRMKHLIRSSRPDVVHVHSELWGLLVLQALSQHDRVVAHGADNQFFFGSGPQRYLRTLQIRRTIPRLAGYVSWNATGAALARAMRPDLPTLVAPGVAVAEQDSRDAFVAEVGMQRIGFIGRLDRRKGFHHFATAMRTLLSLREDVIPVVIGDGPLRDEADSLGSRAEVLGALSHLETQAMMQGLDILVVPSIDTPEWREQYCRVAVEAMARRVPLIYSDAGALPEVVGDSGLIYSQSDVAGLQKAIESLLDNRQARHDLSHRGYTCFRSRHRPGALAPKLREFWADVNSRLESRS